MPEIQPILVERATTPTAEVRALVGELDAELSRHYPPEQRHGLKLDAIFRPHVLFFVARLDGIATGCGGVASVAATSAATSPRTSMVLRPAILTKFGRLLTAGVLMVPCGASGRRPGG